jgi:hypothetical protein
MPRRTVVVAINIRNSLPQRDDSTVLICLTRIIRASNYIDNIRIKAI